MFEVSDTYLLEPVAAAAAAAAAADDDDDGKNQLSRFTHSLTHTHTHTHNRKGQLRTHRVL